MAAIGSDESESSSVIVIVCLVSVDWAKSFSVVSVSFFSSDISGAGTTTGCLAISSIGTG